MKKKIQIAIIFFALKVLLGIFILLYIILSPICDQRFPFCKLPLSIFNSIGLRSGWGFWGMFKHPSAIDHKIYVNIVDNAGHLVESQEVCKPALAPSIMLEFCQRHIWQPKCTPFKQQFIASFCEHLPKRTAGIYLTHYIREISDPKSQFLKKEDTPCYVMCN